MLQKLIILKMITHLTTPEIAIGLTPSRILSIDKGCLQTPSCLPIPSCYPLFSLLLYVVLALWFVSIFFLQRLVGRLLTVEMIFFSQNLFHGPHSSCTPPKVYLANNILLFLWKVLLQRPKYQTKISFWMAPTLDLCSVFNLPDIEHIFFDEFQTLDVHDLCTQKVSKLWWLSLWLIVLYWLGFKCWHTWAGIFFLVCTFKGSFKIWNIALGLLWKL